MAFDTTSTEALIAARKWWLKQGLAAMAVRENAVMIGCVDAINMIDAELAARSTDVPCHTHKFSDAAYVASFAA
jgi:hypothetical protein